LDMAWRKDAASPVLRAFLAEVQQRARSIQPKAR
jgi:hypothetical protein